MTKISILIATYNRAELVKQAVISALAQPFKHLEVIVVDDGSTDHTEKAIRSLNEPKVRYIFQSNQGAASAWNRGFQASTGDDIGILGDDDAYLPDGLAPLARLLDEQQETGVAGGGYITVDETGSIIEEQRPWQSHSSLGLETWLYSCPLLLQSALVRRQWFEKLDGFDTELANGPDDWDFFLRLAGKGCTMRWSNTLVFYYRVHIGRNVLETQQREEKAIYILDKFFKSPDLSAEVLDKKDSAYLNVYLNTASHNFACGYFDEGWQMLNKAIDFDPSIIDQGGEKLAKIIANWHLNWLHTLSLQEYTNMIINKLQAAKPLPYNFKNHILAEVEVVKLFRAKQADCPSEIRRAGYKILKYYPKRIFELGLFSIFVKAFFELNIINGLKRIFNEKFISHNNSK